MFSLYFSHGLFHSAKKWPTFKFDIIFSLLRLHLFFCPWFLLKSLNCAIVVIVSAQDFSYSSWPTRAIWVFFHISFNFLQNASDKKKNYRVMKSEIHFKQWRRNSQRCAPVLFWKWLWVVEKSVVRPCGGRVIVSKTSKSKTRTTRSSYSALLILDNIWHQQRSSFHHIMSSKKNGTVIVCS